MSHKWVNSRMIGRLLGAVAVLALIGVTDQRTDSSASAVRLPNGMVIDTISEAPDKSAQIQVTAEPLKAGETLPRYPKSGQKEENYFGIRCIITNRSKKFIEFHSATCSWWDEWTFSDKRVDYCIMGACFSNYPKTIMLNPHETFVRVLPLTLQHVQTGDKVRFRIGFRKDIWNGDGLINPLQQGIEKEKIFWSATVVVTASDTAS